MSNQVTGGMIAVEDGVRKSEDYAPPRKVRVELKFDVAEGANPAEVIGYVGALASTSVADLLAGRATSPAKPVSIPANDPNYGIGANLPAAAEPAGEAPKRHRRTKAEMEAAAAAATIAEVKATPPQPFPSTIDPAAITEAPGAGAPAANPAEAAGDITDGSLLSTVTGINAKIKKAPEITKIILKYCPADGTPPSLKKIPQEKRRDFIAELQAWAATQKVAE